jgi:hypothetical protein
MGRAVAEFNRVPRTVAGIYNPSSSDILRDRTTEGMPKQPAFPFLPERLIICFHPVSRIRSGTL